MKHTIRTYWTHRKAHLKAHFSYGKHLHSNTKRTYLISALPLIAIILGAALYFTAPKKQQPTSAQFHKSLLADQFVATDTQTNITTSLEAKKNELIMEVKRGEAKTSFSMALSQAKANQAEKTTVSYALPSGTTMKYETIPEGIKEEIIFHKPLGRSTIMTTLTVDNVEPFMTSEGQIVFLDTKGAYQFHIRQPFAIDANGTVTHAIKYRLINYSDTYQTIKKNINENTSYSRQLFGPINTKINAIELSKTYTMVLELDPSWFSDPNRAYPITIDPTVVHDTSAEFATGQLNRVKDTGSGSSPVLSGHYQEAPTDQNTVGLWHMDNVWTDSSGNGNTGTAQGNATFTTSSLLGTHAGLFDGLDDSVQIPDNTTTSITGRGITLAAWVYLDAGETTAAIIHKGLHYSLYINANQLTYADSVNYSYANNGYYGTIPTQTWTHIAVTFDGNARQMYINGVLVGINKTYSGSITDTAIPLLLGCYDDSGTGGATCADGASFDGMIDDALVKNVALTTEQIKSLASRRPSSVYTSDVIDLSTVASWNSLIWTENGVTTGDGETLKDTTGLVAQWNFNNTTNTTTASNDAGSCGASCNGTLTNFSTGSSAQDALAMSGWTANNRRWGTGALMLDGTNDYVDISNDASLNFASGNFSLESWVKTNTVSRRTIITKLQSPGPPEIGYALDVLATGQVRLIVETDASNYIYADSSTIVNDGNWHHVVGMRNGATVKLYIDGVDRSGTQTTIGTVGTTNNTVTVKIGYPSYAGSTYFIGMIDSTRIYSRALTASEIISNYNAGNVEFQTRVGSSTDPNDGTWEAWRPVTNETQITGFNDAYQYDAAESNLVGYWPMDESANGTCTGAKDVCDVTGTNHGTQTNGPFIVDGVFGKARSFDGTDDYVDVGDTNTFDFGSGNFAIEAWVKRNVIGATQMIVSKDDNGARQFFLTYMNTNVIRVSYIATGDAQVYFDTPITVTDTNWHHIIGQRNGNTFEIYKDGKLAGTGTTGGSHGTMQATATTVRFGQRIYPANNNYLNGVIDEVRIYNTALSAATVLTKYLQGSTNPAFLRASASTVIKTEGSAAQKIQTGQLPVDTATVGLWHMDETGGTSAYIKDGSGNGNHGTPTGASVTDGISSKGRFFTGSSQYISVTDSTAFTFGTGDLSVEVWVKPLTVTGNYEGILGTYNGASGIILTTSYGTNGHLAWWNTTNGWIDSGYTLSLGQWQHVAITRKSGTISMYVNGSLVSATPGWTGSIDGSDLIIGGWNASYAYLNGSLDEVRLSNVARSTEEIAESYRMGRDHYMSKTISSTDLSGKQSLPFSIAADRPGTYLEATVGETSYANYQSDANTVGLWHLDEQGSTPTSCYSLLNSGVTTDGYYTIDPDGSGANAPVMVYCDMTTDGGGWTRIAKFGTAYNIAAATYSTGFGAAYSAEYAHPCALFNAYGTNITTRVNMGSVKDYYRPTSSYTLCQMITETPGTHFTWSSNNGTFQTPTYYSAHLGGSATSWPVGIDGRTYLSFWGGSGSATSGCCHNTSTIYGGAADGATWGRAFDMFVRETTPTPSQLIKDTSGYANNGALAGATMIQGQRGNARNFDGNNDYVDLGSGSSLDFGNNGAFTYVGWVRPTTLVDYAAFVSKVINGRSGVYSHMTTFMANGTLYAYTGAAWVNVCPAGSVANGVWTHVAFSYNGTTLYGYTNGQLCGSVAFTYTDNTAYNYYIGSWYSVTSTYDFNGIIDEVSISNVSRSASEIRQLYETGVRAHPITIDFGAKLDSENLITGSGDTGFTVDATYYGLAQKGSNLFLGDTIIVRENYDGTEYIAQGTINSVNISTGAVTVAAWGAGGTFPSGGFTANASVFKWQREYWNITEPLDDQINATTLLTLRLINGNEGRTIWLDNLQSNSDYTTTPAGSTVTSSTGNRYFQYRSIFHSFDESVSAQLSSVTLDYVENTAPTTPTTLLTEGVSNPTSVIDTTPEFSAIYTDSDVGDIANKYEIQVDDANDFSSPLWDSGGSGTSMTNCIAGIRCADISYAGSALNQGTTYYWRIKFWDDSGAAGAWSAETATFTMNNIPSVPVLDTPADTVISQPLSPTLRTTGADQNSDYLQYKIELCTNSGMTTNCQTFNQTSSQTGWSNKNAQSNTAYLSGSQASYTIQTPLTVNTTYYWRSYSIDPGGANSWSSTQGAPFSFTTTDGSQKFNLNGLQLNGININ